MKRTLLRTISCASMFSLPSICSVLGCCWKDATKTPSRSHPSTLNGSCILQASTSYSSGPYKSMLSLKSKLSNSHLPFLRIFQSAFSDTTTFTTSLTFMLEYSLYFHWLCAAFSASMRKARLNDLKRLSKVSNLISPKLLAQRTLAPSAYQTMRKMNKSISFPALINSMWSVWEIGYKKN